MNLTGFNPDTVVSSMNAFMAAAHDTLNVLCKQFQSQFVDKMAEVWACNNAQNYFNNTVKPQMDDLTSRTDSIFASVVESMKQAGNNWADQTGTPFQGPSYISNRQSLNVSSIKENINGVRGIDLNRANSVADGLSKIMSEAESALSRGVNAVRECGFIGGDSAAMLLSSLNSIHDKTNTVLQDCSSQLKKAITETTNTYQTTEQAIAKAFAGE